MTIPENISDVRQWDCHHADAAPESFRCPVCHALVAGTNRKDRYAFRFPDDREAHLRWHLERGDLERYEDRVERIESGDSVYYKTPTKRY